MFLLSVTEFPRLSSPRCRGQDAEDKLGRILFGRSSDSLAHYLGEEPAWFIQARFRLSLSRFHLSMAPPWSRPSPLPVANGRLVILYASQTGNAMDVAERVGREAKRGGCPDVDLLSMDSFNPSCLPGEGFVVFVVSTMGQGDPPDSMKSFWKYLLQKHLGSQWLEGLQYAVFGLGDSGYQKYNFPAKKLDQRLSDLGAKQIINKGLGDYQHPAGYEGALDPWLQSLWQLLNETNTSILPRITDIVNPNMDILGDANVEVIYYGAPQDANISDSMGLIGRARSMSLALKFHNDGEPQYIQNPSAVDAFIKRCNLDPDCYITIRAKGSVKVPESSLANSLMDRIKLKTFAALTMDDFPSVQMRFEWLVQLTPPLNKRAYSISSSPLAHPNQIHLTVSIVTPLKRQHGLCSTWLARLSPNKESLIPCWIRQGSLPRPLPSIPLVLIGPGTGCAPFRAFVEERTAQAAVEPTAPVLFFFGCRNQDSDFLYKNFWLNHAQNYGVLSAEKGGGFFKIYVQDKIKEQSERVMNILCSNKAVIYVVGCSTKMPADVTAALEEVICQESGNSKENVSEWLKTMKKAGNFIIEA
ncbi:hypothetical protein EJB05_48623, partial [Eragrostis curvula]